MTQHAIVLATLSALFLLATEARADGGTVRPTGRVEPKKASHHYAPIAPAKGKANSHAQEKKNASGVARRAAGN